jgi:hypothetical protein
MILRICILRSKKAYQAFEILISMKSFQLTLPSLGFSVFSVQSRYKSISKQASIPTLISFTSCWFGSSVEAMLSCFSHY